MAEILLVRHGQASFGSDNYDQLSELGYRQGRLLGQHFLQKEHHFNALYSGTLARQQQTAQALIDVYRAAAVDVPELTIDAAWNEFDNHAQVERLLPGLLEKHAELKDDAEAMLRDKKSFQKVLRAVFQYWIVEQPETEGLESWPEAKARFEAALKTVMKNNGSGQSAAAFTSGGVVAALSAIVMGMGADKVYGLFEPVINASITRLIHSQNNISLSSFNEHQYLTALSGDDDIISYR
ncbi:histidine phosphatase family protein [Pseudoteredinibacter isoporae]|uniref:Broad specificity phosphatase PhoE n=1 Tax=Pseudoteredinibacter isoporae TaxID=570281 RepID=A0A7X0JQV1_9GAMM|nr:histidine phosphatase family protein [Pseudoteredinibacter isoporae]MBB6520462.1 broad specificity phosphatase PhoE [Pseudoteredinibacter isoporae]NHO86029.1 histidine phosphatase family protein [Pseudoteredinibacter isoporae]NIB25520.1 histidine phosphatase family protein [Pseudoteredinibacter isoporae]